MKLADWLKTANMSKAEFARKVGISAGRVSQLAIGIYRAWHQNGLFDRKTATSFRKNILERGGTADAMDLWKAFRGREPDVEPLLKRRGLK